MDRDEMLLWLRETDERRLAPLWRRADRVRRDSVGDHVHLRGLVEFSNQCARGCLYCGLRADNRKLVRYRMSSREILSCARRAAALGYGTVVLQSGEDPTLPADWLAEVIRLIKASTRLAVTLSLGEKPVEQLDLWRRAGADRYLLRFETSDRGLYERIHPSAGGQVSDRIAAIRLLQRLGYETGSGVMVGIPGQTWRSLAADIALFAELGLDMIGVGPFLPHPDTPLGQSSRPLTSDQPPNDEVTTCKVLALSRIACPRANIPATTALATLDGRAGYERALACGANVIMPNITPPRYRRLYQVYPGKACVTEPPGFHAVLRRRIQAAGRSIGAGRGDSPRRLAPAAERTP